MVIDTVWMLVHRDQTSVAYAVGDSAPDVWRRVLDSQLFGTAATRNSIKDMGYRAQQVEIHSKK